MITIERQKNWFVNAQQVQYALRGLQLCSRGYLNRKNNTLGFVTLT